eukprot:scaffold90257_cov24-Tisochrysis_lutea.AAC.4
MHAPPVQSAQKKRRNEGSAGWWECRNIIKKSAKWHRMVKLLCNAEHAKGRHGGIAPPHLGDNTVKIQLSTMHGSAGTKWP